MEKDNIESIISFSRKLSRAFDIDFEVDNEAVHLFKAYQFKKYSDIENTLIKAIKEAKGKDYPQRKVAITLNYVEKNLLYLPNIQSVNPTKLKDAEILLDNIEKTIKSLIKESEGDKKVYKTNVETIAVEMKNHGYLLTTARGNVKQFLYNQIRPLQDGCKELLTSEKYSKRWTNARNLLVFRKMINV